MSKEEQIKFEYNALIEEFKTVRQNMMFDIGAARQVINLTLTATGVLIAGTPFIVQSRLLVLYLVAPMIFYALAWAQIRYLYLDNALSDYVIYTIAPRLRRTLSEFAPNEKKDFDSILSWETILRDIDRRSGLVLFLIAAGNYGIHLLVAALSISAYFFFAIQQNVQVLAVPDILLIPVNVLFFSYTAFLGFWARSHFGMKTSKGSSI